VDYREKYLRAARYRADFSSARDAEQKETLTSRMIDRPIRPLFPKGWSFETQVIALVLSADLANDPPTSSL